ncbi:MAG: hypothetical protein LBD01_01340 [Puniceicoccales bacterium]|nr:hypothetical protein [Puniceicoccales bacterium]
MKKTILTASGAFLACAVTAVAGPINGKGIPADAFIVGHIDCDAAVKTPLGREIKRLITATPDSNFKAEDFKKKGIAQVNDITLGSVLSGGKDVLTFVVRGQFQPELIYAAAAKDQLKIVNVGKHRFAVVNLSQKMNMKNTPVSDTNSDHVYFCPIDTKTIIGVSDLKCANQLIAAHSGAAKSYMPPAALLTYGKNTGTPWVLAYGTNAKPQASSGGIEIPLPKTLFVALGEHAGQLKSRVALDYNSSAEAQQFYDTVHMVLSILTSTMASQVNDPDGKPDPAKVKSADDLKKIIAAVKHSAKDKRYTLSFDWPATELIRLIKEAENKKQKLLQ